MVAEPLVEKAYALGSRMAFASSFVPLYALSTRDRVPGAKLVEIIWEVSIVMRLFRAEYWENLLLFYWIELASVNSKAR